MRQLKLYPISMMSNVLYTSTLEEVVAMLCGKKDEASALSFNGQYTIDQFEVFYAPTATSYLIDADVDERCGDFSIDVFAVNEIGQIDDDFSNDLAHELKTIYDSFHREAYNQAKEIKKDQLCSI